ncbi:MAG: glycoside hydrolase family 13 protein [Sphaerochaetaceae bacterium]|nr:glycoside hydrolase family 13 protein [Sphaerochaetaceae bacterium]
MNKAAIFHRPSREYVIPNSPQKLTFRLLTARNDCSEIILVHWKRGTNKKFYNNLLLYSFSEFRDDYRVTIEFDETAHYIQYYFILKQDDEKDLYFSQENLFEKETDVKGYFEHAWSNRGDIFKVPEWAKGIVFYQIFPDRFYRLSEKNNPMLSKWASRPTREDYTGGNLRGIICKLSYLKELGIQAIYLCPIFKAKFNHRYATVDYFEIDPLLGNKEDLKELVYKSHELDIKIILDGVFNHVSTEFDKFEEYKIKGVDNGWFYPNSNKQNTSKIDYECVGDYEPMPKLNTYSIEVKEFLYSVMKYWIDFANIDGWRIDVADEIDIFTLQYLRYKIKDSYPSCLLLGETWGDGVRNVGFGDQLDCVMNYQFRSAMIDLFATKKIGCADFVNRIGKTLSCYTHEVNQCNYNLISSHDVARFLTECKDDKTMFALAICFQMTFIGSPAIYYGDENEMTGENDPECRACMNFEKGEICHDLYKELIDMRSRLVELKKGDFRFIAEYVSETSFAFERKYEDKIKVIFNIGGEKIDIRSKSKLLYSYPKNQNNGVLAPYSMVIIKMEENYEK